MEGESIDKVKDILSLDGFIVLTIEPLLEEKNKTPRFIFEALKENKSRIEWKVDAIDIFSAYEILVNDYQYTVLRLYPITVTDPQEQDAIFKNILQIFPEDSKKDKDKEPISKGKTFTEVDLLKKYLDVLSSLVEKSNLNNKEILLYDIKRVQIMNSISSIEEVIKKTVKTLYNKWTVEEKRIIYKDILPITKHEGVFIFPPWVFRIYIGFQGFISMMNVLFWSDEKKKDKKEEPKKAIISKIIPQNDSPEKKIFTNKNILLLLKKKYRSSWLDIFKMEGSYLYFYTLLRQNKILFLFRRSQEYIGKISIYTLFLLVWGIIVVWGVLSPQILFFNGFVFIIMSGIFLSLVFFFKEI